MSEHYTSPSLTEPIVLSNSYVPPALGEPVILGEEDTREIVGHVHAQAASLESVLTWQSFVEGNLVAAPAVGTGSFVWIVQLAGEVIAQSASLDSVVDVKPFPQGVLRPVLRPKQLNLTGVDCSDDKDWAERGCPAFRAIAKLVSPTYPVQTIESVDRISPDIGRSVLFKSLFWESADSISVGILSAELRKILVNYFEYPWESVDAISVNVLPGELTVILRFYETYPWESADSISVNVLPGELRQILIKRTQPWESVDNISVSILSGELQ